MSPLCGAWIETHPLLQLHGSGSSRPCVCGGLKLKIKRGLKLHLHESSLCETWVETIHSHIQPIHSLAPPLCEGWIENISAYTDFAGYFSYFKRVSPNTNIKFSRKKSKTFFERYSTRFCLKIYKNERVGMIKTINEIIKIQ